MDASCASTGSSESLAEPIEMNKQGETSWNNYSDLERDLLLTLRSLLIYSLISFNRLESFLFPPLKFVSWDEIPNYKLAFATVEWGLEHARAMKNVTTPIIQERTNLDCFTFVRLSWLIMKNRLDSRNQLWKLHLSTFATYYLSTIQLHPETFLSRSKRSWVWGTYGISLYLYLSTP